MASTTKRGKSTLGKTVVGIYTPTAGDIRFAGREIGRLPRRERRSVAKDLQYVYQDPGASLDPRWKIGPSLHEPLKIHTTLTRAERDREVRAILATVGLPNAHLDLYPHELSGGQQRRVGLARIPTLRPRLVILDEPTSGLDVSVQASVLKLFRSLQATFALTYVFISHDLSVVRAMCAGIVVMYLGKIVELGPTAHVFETPRHPYAQSLLAAVPRIGGRRVTQDFALEGDPPNPRDLPSGCRFRTRCLLVQAGARRRSHRSALSTGASWPVTSPDPGTRGIVRRWWRGDRATHALGTGPAGVTGSGKRDRRLPLSCRPSACRTSALDARMNVDVARNSTSTS